MAAQSGFVLDPVGNPEDRFSHNEAKIMYAFMQELITQCHVLLVSGNIRVGTSIVQPVNSSGKCRKLPARQILQKSLRWQILAFMNKIKLKTCEIKNYAT